jgi:hypothetical protein
MLAPILLSVALAQPCPQPLSPSDPPPCAVANVPGCLPGYTAVRDRNGRVLYACATSAAPAAPVRPTYAAPAYAPPAPAAPYLAYAPREERRGRLALVLTPGRTTDPALGVHGGHDLDRFAGAAALELRGRRGGARVRVQYQHAEVGRVAELGLKYDFLDRTPLRPFVGIGVGAASLDPETRWRASGSLFGGFDLYLDRNAFLTAEIQGRRFANRTSDAGHALEVTGRRQTTVLVGIGIYL